MTESSPAEVVVAVIKACDQYRFRVRLPGDLSRTVRAELRSRAILETNETFIDCTRRYQAIGWLGAANLAFADSRHSPSDSKSEFLHLLTCLKTIELSFRHFSGSQPPGDGRVYVVKIDTPLSLGARKGIGKIAVDLGLRVDWNPDIPIKPPGRIRIGGMYRAARQGQNAFSLQPIRYLEIFRSIVVRRLTPVPLLRRIVSVSLRTFILLFWPFPLLARLLFSFYYQTMARRILDRLDSEKNTFVYFDLRLGRNRDVAAYLRWKYGDAFNHPARQRTVIPFTHIARTGHSYSVGVMIWAYRALKMMEKNPTEGCVVVNFLIPPGKLLETQFVRGGHVRVVRRKLVEFEREATECISRMIYREFVVTVDINRGFPVELAACYDVFFQAMRPGVVIQADAIAKTARHFTASAKRNGSRGIYVADRICTNLRTSNQFIRDGGDNPHLPDRCVVFDQVTRQEFVRQGMEADHLYVYQRHFNGEEKPEAADPRENPNQVLILLQAYEDNIGAMVRLGGDIARNLPELQVFYQEHPNFPVNQQAKAALLAEAPGRLHFLNKGDGLDSSKTLALITGYSTAAVPGVLHGAPLIWLRRQIDNSIFCEAFLDRIGFAADSSEEVTIILKRLLREDEATLQKCLAATAEARAIFSLFPGDNGRGFAETLTRAVEDFLVDIPKLNG